MNIFRPWSVYSLGYYRFTGERLTTCSTLKRSGPEAIRRVASARYRLRPIVTSRPLAGTVHGSYAFSFCEAVTNSDS